MKLFIAVAIAVLSSPSTFAGQPQQKTFLRPGSIASPLHLLTASDAVDYIHPDHLPVFPGLFLRGVNRIASIDDWAEIFEHLAESGDLFINHLHEGSVGLFGLQAARVLFEKAATHPEIFAKALKEYEMLNTKSWEAELAKSRLTLDLKTHLSNALRYPFTSFGRKSLRLFIRNAVDRGDYISAAYIGNWLVQIPPLFESVGDPIKQAIKMACERTYHRTCLQNLGQAMNEVQVSGLKLDVNQHVWEARAESEPLHRLLVHQYKFEAVDFNFETQELVVFGRDNAIERINITNDDSVTEAHLIAGDLNCENPEYQFTDRAHFAAQGNFLLFESHCEPGQSILVFEKQLNGWQKIYQLNGRIGIISANTYQTDRDQFLAIQDDLLIQLSFVDQRLTVRQLDATLSDPDFNYVTSADNKYAAVTYWAESSIRRALILIDMTTGTVIWGKSEFSELGQIEFGEDAVFLYDNQTNILSKVPYATLEEQILTVPQFTDEDEITLVGDALWLTRDGLHEHAIYTLDFDAKASVNFQKPLSPARIIDDDRLMVFYELHQLGSYSTHYTQSFVQVQEETLVELTPSRFDNSYLHVEVSPDKSQFFVQQEGVAELYANPEQPFLKHGRLSKLEILRKLRQSAE